MSHRIQLRRDKAAFWAQEDPVLAQGELAWSTDTGELKIGDGTTPWSGLANILGNPGEPGGSSETLIFDTAGQLWDSEDFGDIPNGTLILIRDYGDEQENAGGALLRMVNDGVSEPDTETVVVGIPAGDGQFRAVEWFYDEPEGLPQYTLAESASMTVALSDQIFIEETGGQINIYFPSDTLLERQVGAYSKSSQLLLALSDMSKAVIIETGGFNFSGGDKNYRVAINSNLPNTYQVSSDIPLLDIQDILNGLHDEDTFIVGNVASVSSTAQWGQEETTRLNVSGTLQPNRSSLVVTDPGSGKIAFDSLNMTEVTRIVLSKTAGTAQEVLDWIINEDPTPDYGDRLLMMSLPDQDTQGFVFKLGNFFDNNGDFVSIDAQYVGNNDGELPATLVADEPVELFLLHNPFEVSIDLSNYVTQDEFQEVLSGIFTLPRPLSVPIGYQPEVNHTFIGLDPLAELGGISPDAIAAVNAGASMVLEINLNYYLKPNGTLPSVILKIGNIEVNLPTGTLPGADSILYFDGIVTLFISKPASDIQVKAMTRFRSYETFDAGELQDDLVHFPGDYLGNDEYTVTGEWVTDGAWFNNNPFLLFDGEIGIKGRLEKASGQYSLAF